MWKRLRSEPERLPTPTGAFQPIPPPSTGCSDPAKLSADPILANACHCQEATNAAIDLVNTYAQQVEDYNKDLVDYKAYVAAKDDYEQCALNGNCQGEYARYQLEYDNNYKNQKKLWTTCRENTNGNKENASSICASDLESGWVSTQEFVFCTLNTTPPNIGNGNQPQGSCSGGKCFNGIASKCQRTLAKAQSDWEPYFRGAVKSPDKVDPPQPPEFDAQIAITCCSQSFKNINGDTVKIYDITQECSAEVNKYITDVNDGTPPDTLPPNYDAPPQGAPPNEEAPASLKTFAIVLIAVAVLVFWVGVRLRKRSQKSKTPAPPPLAPSS